MPLRSLLPVLLLTYIGVAAVPLAALEARHALVIVNNDYVHARKLDTPANDVAVIAASLKQAGTGLNILILGCCRDDPYSRSRRGKRAAEVVDFDRSR